MRKTYCLNSICQKKEFQRFDFEIFKEIVKFYYGDILYNYLYSYQCKY